MIRRGIPLVFALLMLTPLAARADDASPIVERARLELARVTQYSGEWLPTNGYPLGDVASNRGACTDLVIRALRAAGIDLQELVHQDIVRHRGEYGIASPDPQVDHRRVNVLLTYFQRNERALSLEPRTFRAGDIVFLGPTKNTPHGHVAIVSDRVGLRGLPLLIENGGPRPSESDSLGARPILGHFRARTCDRDTLNALLDK